MRLLFTYFLTLSIHLSFRQPYVIHQLAFVDIIFRGLMRHSKRLVPHVLLPPKSSSECRGDVVNYCVARQFPLAVRHVIRSPLLFAGRSSSLFVIRIPKCMKNIHDLFNYSYFDKRVSSYISRFVFDVFGPCSILFYLHGVLNIINNYSRGVYSNILSHFSLFFLIYI